MGAYDISWGFPVIGYLFLAGVGAGVLTVSASLLLRGGGVQTHFHIARYGALLAVPLVGIGTAFLVFELGSFEHGHWFRFINLYKVMNLSPMSVGTWMLTLFLILGTVYAYTFIGKDAYYGDRFDKLRRTLAWISVPLAIGVAIYTGVLLGAMPARPLWNSPILAFLFLISSISTGMAVLLLFRNLIKRDLGSGETQERELNDTHYMLASTDTLFLGLELLGLFLFIMYAHLTVGSVREAIQVLEFGGEMAGSFWLGVVLLGLLIPAAIELYLIVPRLVYGKTYVHQPMADVLVPVLVLIGGFMLRYVIVIAGQITYPIGL